MTPYVKRMLCVPQKPSMCSVLLLLLRVTTVCFNDNHFLAFLAFLPTVFASAAPKPLPTPSCPHPFCITMVSELDLKYLGVPWSDKGGGRTVTGRWC